jgi:glycosyltransferase involved in cell wall biosynthesis
MSLASRSSYSKTRVAFICPCIGAGGADALMLGLVRYAFNIQFTGICVTRDVQPYQLEWARNLSGNQVKFHVAEDKNPLKVKGLTYHETLQEATYAACKDADVIVTWSTNELKYALDPNLKQPIVEYAQNSDEFAREVVTLNKHLAHYKAACSKMAAGVYELGDEVKILYNGIDPGRVCPRKGRETQRKVWGIEPDKKVLLFSGRMVKEKRPEAVIQAICNLPADWIGIIAGKGELINELRRMCSNFCPGRIAFVDSQYHVGDLLAAADVFILPTDFEGHPLSVLEAWLAGLPTVVTDLPCIQEMEEEFGPLTTKVPVAPKTNEIVEAVLKAGAEEAEIFNMSNIARSVVWQNFTLPVIANQWEGYLDGVVFDHRRRRRLTEIHPAMESEPLGKAHG